MKEAPHYWDAHTSNDMKAHLYEYADRCKEAAREKSDADWMFFFGARKAVQRLLFLYKGRREALDVPTRQRNVPRNCRSESLQSCFICMGSGVHPQTRGGATTQQRIDYLTARVKRQLSKMKDVPKCPLCGGEIYYGVYLRTEYVSPSCYSCQSHYGSNGFKTLKEAVRFMRGRAKT